MISLLCPSRSRPQKSFETIESWVKRAVDVPLEVLIGVENDEFEVYKKHWNLKSYWNDKVVDIYTDDYKNAVAAINDLAKKATKNILIVVSDDTEAPNNWARRIIKYTEGRRDFVMKVRDGIQPSIITMPILDRAYFQRDGFIYHPKFEHAWSDRFFTDLAHKRKRVITKNILFKHNHYSVMKDKKRDAQYAVTDATFEPGRKIYHELKKEYGL